MKTITNFFKKWREIEKNASWKGQLLGLFLYGACFKVLQTITNITLATVFPPDIIWDIGTGIGLILGFYVYHKILRNIKNQKNKLNDNRRNFEKNTGIVNCVYYFRIIMVKKQFWDN